MFALWTSVTLRRPWRRAYSKAYTITRSLPNRVMIAIDSAAVRRGSM
jgi:hypothetical protein